MCVHLCVCMMWGWIVMADLKDLDKVRYPLMVISGY